MINEKVIARINKAMLEVDDKISKAVTAKVRKERQKGSKQEGGVTFDSTPDYNESDDEIWQSDKTKRDILKIQKAIDHLDNQEQSNIA